MNYWCSVQSEPHKEIGSEDGFLCEPLSCAGGIPAQSGQEESVDQCWEVKEGELVDGTVFSLFNRAELRCYYQ